MSVSALITRGAAGVGVGDVTSAAQTTKSLFVPKINVTCCIWGYYEFYPHAKGETKDITRPICALCKKCVPVEDMQTMFDMIILSSVRQSKSVILTTVLERTANWWARERR